MSVCAVGSFMFFLYIALHLLYVDISDIFHLDCKSKQTDIFSPLKMHQVPDEEAEYLILCWKEFLESDAHQTWRSDGEGRN